MCMISCGRPILNYKHLVRRVPNGPVINVIYKNKDNDPHVRYALEQLADAAVMVLPFIEKTFGNIRTSNILLCMAVMEEWNIR
jgi:hypothetical protein